MICLFMGCAFSSTVTAQDTHLHVFTDLSFVGSDEQNKHTSFQLGEYVLYMVSDLTDRISFLGETAIEYHNGFEVDVERVAFRYHHNDHINLGIGKHHTPLGFWNTAYHHGTVLQPTIGRPLMLSFENRGGIMPIHTVGVTIWGHLISGIQYEFMVGNGIGSNERSDNDDSKSLTLSFHKELTSQLRIGLTGYADRIQAGVLSLQQNDDGRIPLAASVRQTAIGGNIHYQKYDFEFLGEIMQVSNSSITGNGQTIAYYLYGGYRLGKVTPYIRFDQLTYSKDEPFFLAEDVQQFLAGVRLELSFMSVLRFEYQFVDKQVINVNRFVFQVALGF